MTGKAFPTLLTLWALLLSGHVCGATITIINMDGAGEGLNDATPVTPIGGNSATTLGQARLNVLNVAAKMWGQRISSSQTIVVEAKFDSMECDATSGVLGSAGSRYYFANDPGETDPLPMSDVFYPAALADAIVGDNVNGRNDIYATFNSDLLGNSTCLNGRYFYLGYDHQLNAQGHPRSDVDLLNTVLHELGHGLGFTSIVNEDGTSQSSGGQLSVFDQFIYDETQGKYWPQLTAAERAASAKNNGLLVWNGAAVNAQIANMLGGISNPGGHLRLYAPTEFEEGSSVSHWDTSANPHLLMEPYITANLDGLTDLTGCVLRDIGWPSARCPDDNLANTPPVAVSQAVTTTANVVTPITLTGSDSDGTGLLSYSIVTQPTLGTLTADGSTTSTTGVVYNYTPNTNASGSDSFTFQVFDGIAYSTPAQVNITISPAATPQQAAADGSGGGGGGSLGGWWLACLAALGLIGPARPRRTVRD